MPEIKHQVPNPAPEVELSGIHIPNDSDLGTGTFTVVLRPTSLPATKRIMAAVANGTAFQITATFNQNGQLAVRLGRANPEDTAIFLIPQRETKQHTLKVSFAAWRILSANLDGTELQTVNPTITH